MFKNQLSRIITILFGLLALCGPVAAQLKIDIVGSNVRPLDLYLTTFQGDRFLAQSLTDIIANDLTRSGSFKITRASSTILGLPPVPVSNADSEISVDGVLTINDRNLQIRIRLYDAPRNKPMGEKLFTANERDWRALSHSIADYIYEAALGIPGVFSSQILFVQKKAPHEFELVMADSDGANPQTALTSPDPLISPAWSPDGLKIAYVSFEDRRPVIFVQDLQTGERRLLANFPGSNSAPAWSPDGKKLAIVLTKDGSSQIYQIDVDGNNLQRLITSQSIDTEPSYSPDGKLLYFTSDRGGSPQIYQLDLSSSVVKRLTFNGRYNVSPTVSPDGKNLAYINGDDAGNFLLQTMELTTGQNQPLIAAGNNERPDYAPNGRFILVSSSIQKLSYLTVVPTVSGASYKLTAAGQSIYAAIWGPLRR